MRILKTILQRIKAACRTNDAQMNAVFLFIGVCEIGLLSRDDLPPWWAFVVVIPIWLLITFVINLIDPIPEEDK